MDPSDFPLIASGLGLAALVGWTSVETPCHRWRAANNIGKPRRKATKDRIKIKAARKQNRSRK